MGAQGKPKSWIFTQFYVVVSNVFHVHPLLEEMTQFDEYVSNGLKPATIPIASMYGIFTYIYHKIKPNVDKYSIHGWYGIVKQCI